MRFQFTYKEEPIKLQTLLRQHHFSSAQIKKLKYHGGYVFVNHKRRPFGYLVHGGDRILIQLPKESPAAALIPYAAPLDVVFEDDYYLVVNKPAGVASIPAANKAPDAMANRVKAYLIKQQAESESVHVVTRLDKDTSGLMLLAKNGLAHSRIDQELHSALMKKTYIALVSGSGDLAQHGWIVLPIGPSKDFYMRRQVTPAGKASVTEYKLLAKNSTAAKVQVLLHTGRTHQIRVHFAALGHPLFGDELYGGPLFGISRQALHCAQLDFWHPFLKQMIHLSAPLPADMVSLESRLGLAADSAHS